MTSPETINIDTLDGDEVKAIAERCITRLISEMENREEGPDEPRSKLEAEEDELQLAYEIIKDHII